MIHADGSLAGAGGVRLFRRSWTPDPATAGPPRGIVVLVHGAGEHGGRYEHVASALVGAGLAVHAVADLDALVTLAGAGEPGAPVFMLGHSMGGMLALRFAELHPDRLAGLILSGALATVGAVPKPMLLIGRALSAVAPRAPLVAIDPRLVSRDPAVVDAYRADPLVHHGKLPARTAAEIVDTVARFPESVRTITTPALIMYGTADGLCPPSGSVMVAERLGSDDVAVRAYDGLFHEILNEPERDQVLHDLLGWLAARIDRSGSLGAAALPDDGRAPA